MPYPAAKLIGLDYAIHGTNDQCYQLDPGRVRVVGRGPHPTNLSFFISCFRVVHFLLVLTAHT